MRKVGLKGVIKDSGFYMLASVIPTAVNFLMLPFFTRVLSPAEYGILGLVTSIRAVLTIAYTFQLHGAINRFYFDYKGIALKTYLSSMFLILFVCSTIMTILTVLYMDIILGIMFRDVAVEHVWLFQVAAVTAYVKIGYLTGIIVCRVQREAKRVMSYSVLSFASGLVATVYYIWIKGKGVDGVIQGNFVGTLIGALLFVPSFIPFFTLKIDFSIIKNSLKFSIPILPSSLFGNAFKYGGRIIMEHYVSLGLIGIFSLADRIGNAFAIIVNKFSEAYMPVYIEGLKNREEVDVKKEINQVAGMVFIMFGLSLIAFTLFSPEIIGIALGKRYFTVWMYAPLMASAFMFRGYYSFITFRIFFEKKTNYIPIITGLAALINVTLCFILVPSFGLEGAIAAYVLAFLSTAVSARYFAARLSSPEIDGRRFSHTILLIYLIMILSHILNQNIYPGGFRLILMVLTWKIPTVIVLGIVLLRLNDLKIRKVTELLSVIFNTRRKRRGKS